MSYNCANLMLSNLEIYQDPLLYHIESLEDKSDPRSVPEGWTILLYADAMNLFELQVLTPYSVFNVTDCVFDSNNIPQYFIGEFQQ